MSTTPPPRFGQVRYEINTNPTFAPRQVTPTILTSSARHPIFELGSIASNLNPVIPEADQAPKSAAIDLVGQMPMTSTVAPAANPTLHRPI
ncbi:hypothetical protein ACOSQ2_031118 [Xanthoceras sorbifolium]